MFQIMDKMIKTKSQEEWTEIIKEKRHKLRELILDDNDEVVSYQELVDRLERRDIEVQVDEGTTHFRDKTAEERCQESDKDYVKTKTAKWPVIKATRMVRLGKHPDELDSVEVRAERMARFDESVTPVFNRQAEKGNFPLKFPQKD